MKYLTYTELKEKVGEKVLFSLGDKTFAAKVYKSDEGYICLAQSRVNGVNGSQIDNKSGFKFMWIVDEQSCPGLYITQDGDIEAFVNLDKKVAEIYRDDLHKMNMLEAESANLSKEYIENIFNLELADAQERIEILKKTKQEAFTPEGIERTIATLSTAAEKLYNSTISQWEAKQGVEDVK